jgi:DNA-binding response OmpR family regulator
MGKPIDISSNKAAVITAQNQLPTASRRRILVTDDDVHLLAIYSEILIGTGYNVDTAADGAEAWRAIQEASYDLLITDNIMPNMSGPELINKLRSEEMTLPVILASGTMPAEELVLHPWLHYARLTKPFTAGQLLEEVKKALDKVNAPARDTQPLRASAALDNETSEAVRPADASIPDPSTPIARILVVDDDNHLRQLSINVLTGAGYNVEGAIDGAAGWRALRTNDYDLIITDNQMPNLTGIEMIEKLRSAHMEVPIIMATGLLPMHEFTHKPWLKPDAMLQRPFSSNELLETVSNVLRTDDGNEGGGGTLLPKYL